MNVTTELPRPRAVIFDWDNTLVDSWDCIRAAMNATLAYMGQTEWSMEETRRRVAKSLRDSFPELFGERWEEARDHFYATFRSIHLDFLNPLPRAEAMLRELADQGVWLAVVSNKNGGFLRKEAERLDWNRYFQKLVGATDAPEDKPSVMPVHMALEGSGIALNRAVWFVGDSPIDMQCAANAGCTPLLVRAEPPAPGEFDVHPPHRYLSGCGELAALVRELSVPISRF